MYLDPIDFLALYQSHLSQARAAGDGAGDVGPAPGTA